MEKLRAEREAGGNAVDRATNGRSSRAKPQGGRQILAKEKFDILNTFTRESMPSLKSAASIKVWFRLFTDMKRDGIAWAGGSYLATATGITRRSAMTAIKELRAKGLIKRVHRGSVNGQTNAYRVFGKPRA
jgi:hypothetical protein